MNFLDPRLPDRFWDRCTPCPTSGCWIWIGTDDGRGYGHFPSGRRGPPFKAYRYAYEALMGPVPEGLELDHLCRVTSCVNPAHLDPVTHLENVRRGQAGALKRNKTHCPQGHAYDEANTRTYQGRRWCRACDRERDRSDRYSKPQKEPTP